MPTLDARPGKLDVVLRPANTTSLELTWPAVLTDRFFDAEVDGEPLEVSVDGAVITVVFDNVTTAALTGRPTWTVTETTGGDDQVLIAGRVLLSYGGTSGQDVSSTIVVNEVSVTVDVVAGGVSEAELAASVAAEAEIRAAADAVLDGRIDAYDALGTLATDAELAALEASVSASYALGLVGDVASRVATDGTDQTAVLQAELDALRTAGGGTLRLPEGTITLTGTITLGNDGATPPKQPAIRIVGMGAHWSGRGTAPVGGTILNITGSATYGKILTSGLGLLSIEGVTFRDTSGGTTPFIYTTNTTLMVQECSFVGSKTGVSCDQDAIILGGTEQIEGGGGLTDGFQGYGTVISRNFFSGIRRCIRGQAFANSVRVTLNDIWTTCGNPTGAAIEWDGKPTTGVQVTAGGSISSNLIEVPNYKYGISLANTAKMNILDNDFFDPTATHVAGVYLASTVVACRVTAGYSAAGGYPYLLDESLTSRLDAMDQGAYSVQPYPWRFLPGYPVKFHGAIGGSNGGAVNVDYGGNEASIRPNGGNNPYPKAAIMVRPAVQATDAVLVSGSPTVTSATAAFTSAQVGEAISGTGIPSTTHILRRVSATEIVMSKNATASASGVTITFGGRYGTDMTMTAFERHHILGSGSAPTASVGAGAGTGATVSVAGTDLAGTVTVTTGTTPAAGVLVNLVPAINWTAVPKLVFTARDAVTAALFAAGVHSSGSTTSSPKVNVVGTPAASTVYVFDYIAIQ